MEQRPAQVYLASQSPRRRELLEQIGISFKVIAATVDEAVLGQETPEDHVLRLALAKARAGLNKLKPGAGSPVIGADTIVVVGNRVLGKPCGKDDAVGMLLDLAGRSHRVMSAVAMVSGARDEVRLNVSTVTFGPISREQALAYWDSGEPADKAGAYAVQGRAAGFIEKLDGSYSGVMGLPLWETTELLRLFGIDILNTEI